MKIAICDDSLNDRSIIKHWFIKNRHDIKTDDIKEFSCGEELLKYVNVNHLDIIYLDCQMKGIDGITTTQKIRGLSNNVIIILVSNYMDYAVLGYELDVFRYVLKCDFKEKASDVFDNASLRVGKAEKKSFWIKIWGKPTKVIIEDVIFIESRRNKVIITLKNNLSHSQYQKLDVMAERLMGQGFIRCHQSYLVNSRYIRQFDKTALVLENGSNIPVSRDFHKTAYDSFSMMVSEGM